ncbi:uncharacterized protein LOC118192506 [Stegodyphus dumicola]|uniref:uncharacterized protein LOC118192506 n=1 Tax=Stegodyphus dumicola TaxID=202533 RepID=UPI0015A8E71B|nr:uncharacterized protein LOC118192506 [Stegodyphus dumicola]
MSSSDEDQNISYDGDSSDSDVQMIEEYFDGKPLKPWEDLPPLTLEKIYSYLSRNDQCRMSLVCSKWAKEFSSPSVWRNVRFFLPEYEYNAEIYPEVKFARRYGHMFRHIEIICKRVRTHLLGIIWKQLKFFLQCLTFTVHLNSVSFTNMGNYFRHLDDYIHDDIFRDIVNFLSAQRNLKTVKFFNSHFDNFEAAEILKALCENNCGKLNCILLKGFVRDSPVNQIENHEIDLSFMYDTLLNLYQFETDYSQIFERIIHAFSDRLDSLGWSRINNTKGVLTSIKMNCEGSRRAQFKGISSSIWKQMRKIFPQLKIDMHLNAGGHPQNAAEFFIRRDIPLRSLDFRHEKYHAPNDVDISFLFHHITASGSNKTLEELSIVWIFPSMNLASEIIPFLLECPKLKILQLYISRPVVNLPNIFNSWEQNRPKSLETVYLTIANIQDPEEASALSGIADDYAPLLQVIGLNLFLIAEVEIRPLRR